MVANGGWIGIFSERVGKPTSLVSKIFGVDNFYLGHRWENQLMGWQSSADFMQGTHIFFKSKDDAIHFAEKQGRSFSQLLSSGH